MRPEALSKVARICALPAAVLWSGYFAEEAGAAGFALKEQSTAAQGNAFAGATAGADDLSYMFFNPAAAARQSGSQVVAVGSYIMPRAELRNGAASAATPVGTVPIRGGNGGNDIAEDKLLPAFYAMWEATPELKFALGVNAPFGLETDYNEGWIGRYHALNSRLRTINFNPVVAYRVHDLLSVGAGLQVQYIDARLTNSIDFGTIGLAGGIGFAVPTAQDGRAKVTGDNLGVGFNAGLIAEPLEGTRIGVAYRSHVRHDIDGDADFTLDAAGVGAALQAATGAFVRTGATAEITTPETVSFGFHQDIGARWSIMGEALWTAWSRFDELRIEFDNPQQPDSVTDTDWHDSWFFAAGVSYRPVEAATLRFGVARDQSPINDAKRTPRIPSEDRTWISIGGAYRPFENFEIALGYSHIFLDDASIDLRASEPGNAARGNLSGSYDSSIDIVSLQAVLRF